MTATAEAAHFSGAMRRIGWLLTAMMLLYPVDSVLSKRQMDRMIAAERAARPPEPASSGTQFDLDPGPYHCGPLGWAGAWAFLIGSLWVLTAGSLWLKHRQAARPLDALSRRAFVVTASGVIAVFVFILLEANGWLGL